MIRSCQYVATPKIPLAAHFSRGKYYNCIMIDPSISVIIPTLNESRALPKTLPALLRHAHFEECLIVDGGSEDGTIGFVQSQRDPRVRLVSARRGRGPQLNAGASEARGACLVFHHADTLLPADAFRQIRAALADGAQWGGFRHRFSEANVSLRIISTLHNLRCERFGAVYGDQSMFVTRALFDRVGGFPETGLEDLGFSDRALSIAPSVLLPGFVVTDSRKFKQIGEWRAFAQVVSILLRYKLRMRLANASFFRDYR